MIHEILQAIIEAYSYLLYIVYSVQTSHVRTYMCKNNVNVNCCYRYRKLSSIMQKCISKVQSIEQCSLVCMRFAVIKEFTVPPGTQRELSDAQRQSARN